MKEESKGIESVLEEGKKEKTRTSPNNLFLNEELKIEEKGRIEEEKKVKREKFVMSKSRQGAICVVARIKPLGYPEDKSSTLGLINKEAWASGGISVTIPGGAIRKFECCDSVICPIHDQLMTFKMVVKPTLIGAFLNGFDCTLFAYGQTGSGKTHTMFGPPGCFSEELMSSAEKDDLNIPSTWGIFPRTMANTLEYLKSQNISAEISLTAVELYCEMPYDLFNNRKPIGISEAEDLARRKSLQTDWLRGICNKSLSEFAFVGTKEVKIKDIEGIANICKLIEVTRVAHKTKMNDRSSRSHCVVTANLSQTLTSGKVNKSKFMFVDLGGSERLGKSGSEGMQMLEQICVNYSLTTLGRCIIAKAAGDKYIPRRESALTMAMAHSFAGKTYTSMIVTLAQNPEHADECRASMVFAANTAKVINNPKKTVIQTEVDIEYTQAMLKDAEDSLKILEAEGEGGGFMKNVEESAQNEFIIDKEKLVKLKAESFKISKCLGKFKGKSKSRESRDLLGREMVINKEIEEIKGQVQVFIDAGLWKSPTQDFINKKTTVQQLTARITKLRAKV